MKIDFSKLTITVMVILFFTGCASTQKTVPPIRKRFSAIFESDDRYYYFTLAQLEKKSGNISEAIAYLNKAIQIDPDTSYLQMELATLYLRQEDPVKALSAVEKIIEKDPENVEALIIYGKIKQNLNYFEDARAAYEIVIAGDPAQRDIYFLLGNLYMNNGDLDDALRVYNGLIEHFPDSYTGYFYIGQIKVSQSKFAEAEKAFRKTQALEPRFGEPYFELIKIYETYGKEKEIVQLYQDLLKMSPDNIRAAMALGYFYHKNDKTKDAERLLKPLGERSKTEKEILRNVLQLYLDQKKYDAAIAVLNGMLKGAPDNSDIHYVMGIAYESNNDREMALMHFKSVKPDSHFYQNAAIQISFIYQEQDNIPEAITFLQDVVKIVPDSPELLLYLGSFYEETEKYEKAETTIKQGLEIDPQNVRLHFRLGVVYDKWGRKEDSIEAMKTVIRLDPKNANALNYLGYTYADLGQNLNEAEQLIREALKYKPDDGYITDSLGWVYFKKKEFKKALMILEQAVILVPDDPIILEHLGDAYLQNNDRENALKFYKRSLLNKNTDTTEVERKIGEIKEQTP